MKILHIIILFLICFSGLIYSCKTRKQAYVAVDPALRALMDFGEGSYWIMEDSITKQRDSFSVTKRDEYTSNGNDLNQVIYESIIEYGLFSQDSVAFWATFMEKGFYNGVGYSDLKTEEHYTFYLLPFNPAEYNYYTDFINGHQYDSVVFVQTHTYGGTKFDIKLNRKEFYI